MISDNQTLRKILEKEFLTKNAEEFNNTHIKPRIDKSLIALGEYYTEIMKIDNVILSRVEIDKAWVKDLIMKSKLLDEAGAERIAEGISIYQPIKMIKEEGAKKPGMEGWVE